MFKSIRGRLGARASSVGFRGERVFHPFRLAWLLLAMVAVERGRMISMRREGGDGGLSEACPSRYGEDLV